MKPPRVLVAGIGNIFFGDDSFGVEVAQRLMSRPQPPYVLVRDFGIRGLDLAYTLLDDIPLTILVDALPRGGAPGTLYVLEPELKGDVDDGVVEGHGINPMKVLGMVRRMGGRLGTVRIVGCEPSPIDMEMETDSGLSVPVRAAVDAAVAMVEDQVRSFLDGEAFSSVGVWQSQR